jgi:peptidoglycan/LPS O-acetylase OafA/YrhL
LSIKTARQLKPLTGVRGFAALAVVIYHYQWYFYEGEFFHFGYLGVDLFFILSGFILTHVHLHDEKILRFYGKRFARVYPVHFVILIGLAAMLFLSKTLGIRPDVPEQFTGRAFVSHLFLLQAWWFQPSSWNYPSWSVSCEWFVYLIFPLLALAVRRLRSLPVIAAVLLIEIVIFAVVFTTIFTIDVDNNSGVVSLTRVFLEFVMGMLLCRLWRSTRIVLPWSLLFAAILVGAAFLGSRPIHDVVVVLGFALVILAGAYGDNWISRILARSWAVYLGEVSYSLYMIHIPVAMTLGKLMMKLGGRFELPAAAQLSGLVLVAVALGIGLYHLIEVPARRRLLALMDARAPLLADAAATSLRETS